MKIIRLVQVTDIHLLENSEDEIFGVNPEKAFREVLSHAVSPTVNPDFIVATGDLSEDGSHSAYSRLQAIFGEINVPTFVLPGNHDSVKNMQESLVNLTIKMEQVTEIGGWVIIFLNSQVEGRAYGIVDSESLLRLEDTLNTNDEKPCLVALHHSPISECLSDVCQLVNKQEFLNVIEKHKNVKGVISGHTHWSVEYSRPGFELLTTPSTFLHITHPQEGESENPEDFIKSHSFDSNKRGYRVIDLFPNGDLVSEVCWVPI